jgi:two-component system chemotaxis sensor kinase CheA
MKKQQTEEKNRSLKIQFTIFFVLFIIITLAIVLLTSYQQLANTTTPIGMEFGAPLNDRASNFINGDSFEQLSDTLDPWDVFYEETRKTLLALKLDTGCRNLYTIAPVKDSSNQNSWRYIIDGSALPSEENFFPLGKDVDISGYSASVLRAMRTKQTVISGFDFFTTYGWVVSTYTPILNSNGEAVGIIESDFDLENFVSNFSSQITRQLILLSVFVVIGFIIYFNMVSGIDKQNRRLRELKKDADQANADLQVERDTIIIMQDNLNTGICLLDVDGVIQGSYSKPLEQILAESDLQGKIFTDLLASSLTEKERDSLKDYFSMVFNRKYDDAMLADLNPISELPYTSVTTGDEKMLRCGFALIERGENMKSILVTIDNISLERQLRMQLEIEENKRQAEMRSLFEVIQVEPKVFADFIEDLEYEFETINASLKRIDMSTYDMLIAVFQSVHAIKSNAIVLGFVNFANTLQELETEIKKISTKDNIPFDDILHITFELDKVMDEKDRFESALEKIRTFRVGDMTQQWQGVLVGTLKRAIDKSSAELGKKTRLVVEKLDQHALDNANRRMIREVLLQLTRNAVFHGIEGPSMRRMQGKDETGSINLSITCRDNAVHIKLSDDGRGFDFEEIKQKAVSLKILKSDSESVSKKDLIQIIFSAGFSTVEQAGMYAGRGIGLNLVRSRISEAKGSIKLQSQEGKGTVFLITIPLEESKVQKTSAEPA